MFRRDEEPIAPAWIDSMVATLRHRGPDGDGSFYRPGIGFGFTRLAIIDLSHASDQPWVDEESGLALVFNGEIYNYIELREELKARGHRFRSAGDGEVILRSYKEWGTDAFRRFNGMFAFALWDGNRRELVLARDRFGEKPLYLARSPRGVVFASEMKAILAVRPELRVPNHRAVARYITRGDLDLDSETFFEGIESLAPSHYLVLDHEMRGVAQRYWEPSAAELPETRVAIVERFRELLFDSVRLRLRSDVPVGSSLSGGLDSSSIVATINAEKVSYPVQQRTFSARFRSRAHDEGRYIECVTNEVEAQSYDVWVDPEDFAAQFERLQWHQEEPIASASPFAQYLVMQLANEHGTTVLLDGQGADELLAGYDQAHGMFWAHWMRKGRPDVVLREMASFAVRYRGFRGPLQFAAYYTLPGATRDELTERYYRARSLLSPGLALEFKADHVDAVEPFPDRLRNELVRWQHVTQLPEFLRYADRNSMAWSREVRLPFLDHRLVEYAFALPPELLLHNATTKLVLREAMRGIVPTEILERRDKLAYAPPQRRWIRGPLKGWMVDHLSAATRRTDVFAPEAVGRLLADVGRHETQAWRVASTEGWFQVMVDDAQRSASPDVRPAW